MTADQILVFLSFRYQPSTITQMAILYFLYVEKKEKVNAAQYYWLWATDMFIKLLT